MTQADNTLFDPNPTTNSNTISSESICRPAMVWAVGGADALGVAADIRAAVANHVQCATVVSSVSATIAGTTSGKMAATSLDMLKIQWKSLLAKSAADVCKVGLLVNTEQVMWLAQRLHNYRQKHPQLTVIYEPVLASSEGDLYIEQQTVDAIKELLLPQVDLLILNSVDMTCLTQELFSKPTEVIELGQRISRQYRVNVLIATKDIERSLDYHYFCTRVAQDDFVMVTRCRNVEVLPEKSCTISSLAASLIANDYSMAEALILAKAIMRQATYQPHPLGNDRDNVYQLSPVNGFNDLPDLYSFSQFISHFTKNSVRVEPAAFAPCEANLALYPVVNSVEWLERLLQLGVKTIQLCCKNLTQAEAEPEVVAAIALGRRYQARLFINDYWRLALKHRAYGVHLGQEDIANADLDAIRSAGLRLGISSVNIHQALIALKLRPSYIALADIFESQTHGISSKPQGLAKLAFQVKLFKHRCPLVAVGGISEKLVAAVKATGVGGIVLDSAISQADDYAKVTTSLLENLGSGDPVSNIDGVFFT